MDANIQKVERRIVIFFCNAYEAGCRVGLDGTDYKNPYPPETGFHIAYEYGYNTGKTRFEDLKEF